MGLLELELHFLQDQSCLALHSLVEEGLQFCLLELA
jgi:hypothetical protein